ncbi:MAG: hypothetical protein J5643_07350 [Lachnospiraceae bacterium]|nr:hypothetical protein [Lachnospiraceae bacterium]
MKFEEINRKFTDTVSEWIAKGYVINSSTMGGHQGEIAKIDLTDGKDIIRILLNTDDKIVHSGEGVGIRIYELNWVALIVGKANAEENRITTHSSKGYDTIWNDKLEVISEVDFYRIGGRNSDWFGSKEEAFEWSDIRTERAMAKHRTRRDVSDELLSDKAKEIVLPFIRRQPRCKTVKASDIEVFKHIFTNRFGNQRVSYNIKVRGNIYTIK